MLMLLFLIMAGGAKAQLLTPVCSIIAEHNGQQNSCNNLGLPPDTCILDSICIGDTIAFTLDGTCWANLISGGHTAYIQYYFNNAPISPNSPANPPINTNNPVKVTYLSPGLYRVDLIARDSIAHTLYTHVWGFVRVLPPPNASFSLTSDSICIGQQVCVSLINNQQGFDTISQIEWGDIITCSGQQTNAGHGYPISPNCYYYDRQGTYMIVVTASNGCPPSDKDSMEVFVSLNPDFRWGGTCPGYNTYFLDSTCNDGRIGAWHWDFGDGDTSNLHNPTHLYQNAGTYTVTLTIYDDFVDPNTGQPCPGSTTITHQVTISNLPFPQIIGNHDNCALSTSYTIANPQPNCTYYWWLSNTTYCPNLQHNGTTINVSWANLYTLAGNNAEFTWLFVTITDSISGCISKDSIKVWKCCAYHVPNNFINDITISDPNYVFTSAVFNGTIIIDANIQLNTSVLMGPEAKIIINPNKTFTVTGKVISAGCKYMWDGVYVKDSNAKVVIQNNGSTPSTVQDALNGVVSEKGGKFELKNSKFLNNYTSVTVSDYFKNAPPYLTAHKGKIYGCAFAKDIANDMIAPYLNGKPRHGIYLNNVYKLTIGDSAQASNVFDNIFCGIASYNSLVYAYKNDFKNIKIPTICSGVFGDYINLYCETAIHSVATSSDYTQYNSSSITSGAGANSRNTFDTCSTAIYSYSTLTKVNNNKVKNTSTGVYCREASGGSYVINSTFKTNTLNAIKFINILPVLSKITIKSDSILDPTNGVYISNITSHATNANYKCKVYSNYITLNKSSGIMYGIRLENSNYIEAYCNTATRTALPTTANRLNVRGIQVEQCQNALIRDNTTNLLGLGIKGAGSLLGTQFKCNTSNGNYNGFYFDANYNSVQTVISDQGISTLPNDNKWPSVPTGFFGIDAASGFSIVPLKNWYYRIIGAQYNFTLSAFAINGIQKTPAGNPVQSSCTTCGGMFMAGLSYSSPGSVGSINENEIESIINESNNYSELDASFKYFEKQYAFHVLNVNTSSLNSITGQYYYDLLAGNIAKFDKVYNLVNYNRIDSAKLLNNNISPTNPIEINRKWVNEIYLDYIMPQVNLPQYIIDDLEILANTSPYVLGDAVYSARNIVNYTEPAVIPKSSEHSDEAISNRTINVNVYPNPANKNISVEIIGLQTELCKFVIRNTLGIELLEKVINTNREEVTIDVSKLSDGLYLYEVMNAENIKINSGRLVIYK